ncbi:hypothetical protein HDU97_008906 [Phlyctochytrium planicorne]|nr:hypothetical protein HDU97_008906 [Phlyctochytrium planicorne]
MARMALYQGDNTIYCSCLTNEVLDSVQVRSESSCFENTSSGWLYKYAASPPIVVIERSFSSDTSDDPNSIWPEYPKAHPLRVNRFFSFKLRVASPGEVVGNAATSKDQTSEGLSSSTLTYVMGSVGAIAAMFVIVAGVSIWWRRSHGKGGKAVFVRPEERKSLVRNTNTTNIHPATTTTLDVDGFDTIPLSAGLESSRKSPLPKESATNTLQNKRLDMGQTHDSRSSSNNHLDGKGSVYELANDLQGSRAVSESNLEFFTPRESVVSLKDEEKEDEDEDADMQMESIDDEESATPKAKRKII